jgi:hypothetical protein
LTPHGTSQSAVPSLPMNTGSVPSAAHPFDPVLLSLLFAGLLCRGTGLRG